MKLVSKKLTKSIGKLRTIEIKSRPTEFYKKKEVENIRWGEEVFESVENERKKKNYVVEQILNKSEAATNNDVILYLECLNYEFDKVKLKSEGENIVLKIPKRMLRFIGSPETYTRSRRTLNKRGIGLPTSEEVIKRRAKKEKAIREYFKKNDY